MIYFKNFNTHSFYECSHSNMSTSEQPNQGQNIQLNIFEPFANKSMNLVSQPENNVTTDDENHTRKRRSAINDYIRSLYEKTYSQEDQDWSENPFSGIIGVQH